MNNTSLAENSDFAWDKFIGSKAGGLDGIDLQAQMKVGLMHDSHDSK